MFLGNAGAATVPRKRLESGFVFRDKRPPDLPLQATVVNDSSDKSKMEEMVDNLITMMIF
jgi:hypothetical protein